MLRVLWSCCALLLVSCSGSSRLDGVTGGDKGGNASGASAAGDPWASPPAGGSAGDKAESGGGALAGFDPMAGLQKVAESLSTPGPYEAREASADFAADKPHWGVLRLRGAIVEREALSFTGGSGTELAALIARLASLASDAQLTGVILRVDDLDISVPDAGELRAALQALRAAGKTVACHVESASNASYLVLAACQRIGLAPIGGVAITGPAALPIHIKPLLDKLGIQADFLHVGAYKGAAEPLTHDAPTRQSEETLGAILDRRYQTMVDVIAAARGLPAADVRALIDTGLFAAEPAKAAKLVDDIEAFEVFRDQVTQGAPWTKLELQPDRSDRMAMMLKLWRFLGAMPPERPAGDHVAVVYALGNIIDGGGDGAIGARQEIASHTLVAALRAITADDAVKAVVLRIDSGGGSAQASELIWRAVAELKARKPVVVSMSDVAASGGYYIACGATSIFALDDTLTGSIGVVGGKLAPAAALARLGVRTFPVGRGKRATMETSLGPWSADERAVMQDYMERVYRTFLARVAEGRGKPAEAVHAIAQGRVWTGARAKELGLVDQIGGLDAALAEARKLGKVDASVGLEIYPPAPTLRDLFAGFGQVRAPFGLAGLAGLAGPAAPGALAELTAVLATLDPRVAAAAEHLVKLVYSFRASTIQAVAVLPVIQ